MRPHTIVLLALCLGAVSCSGPKSSKIKYGVTTAAQLKAEKGEPESVQAAIAGKAGEVLIYPEQEKYQIEKDLVVAGFRNPTADERSLLHWKHKFEGCPTTFLPVNAVGDSHLQPEMELKCAREGESVIYDPNLDAIVRVVEHATQNN